MRIVSVVLAICVFSGLASAEDSQPTKFVRVTGTAEVKVTPDRAVIEVGVEKQDPSATMAKHAEDAAARRILTALAANGVDQKDVQTTYLSLRPEVTYVKKLRTTYFVAQQSMTIAVRDLAKLDGLLESLIKAGGNHIDSVSYETSDLRKYRDQARALAVKAAREKAEALSAALGQGIGRAQTIEEASDSGSFNPLANNVYAGVEKTRAGGASIAIGQKTISASVTVSFELN